VTISSSVCASTVCPRASRAAAREALGQTVDAQTLEEIVTGLEDPSPEVRAWTTNLLPLSCAWSD